MQKIFLYYLLFFSLITLHNKAFAQKYYTSKNVSSKVLKSYTEAKKLIQANNETKAEAQLLKITKDEPLFYEAHIELGNIYFRKKDLTKANDMYLKAYQLSNTEDYRIPFYVGETFYLNNNFTEAEKYLTEFVSKEIKSELLKTNAHKYLTGIDISKKSGIVSFNPSNMGENINSKDMDYFPAFTADDSTMIFARRINDKNEDIFISRKGKDGIWSNAVNISSNINTADNEGALCLSADGKKLFFTGCNREDGLGRCDIYFSEFKNNSWTTPKNLGTPINTDAWEAQPRLSPSGTTLFFSSTRAGGLGGIDIWFSIMKPDGTWSEPKNLGENINTKGDEQSPYLAFDNQTFYFDSNGWQGFGESDLFVSKRDITGKWQKPTNLGYPINTPKNEASLVVNSSGNTGFISSERSDTKGKFDLYSFELPANARATPIVVVKGKVLDSITRQPLTAQITLKDIDINRTVISLQSAADGSFLVCVPINKLYAFHTNSENYLFDSESVELNATHVNKGFYKEILLKKVEKEKTIILRNVYFDVNKYELKTESFAELDNLLKLLQDNPTIKIEISGHTDNSGNPNTNQVLSENRAKSVVEYLTKNNVDKNRLSYIGYGDKKPIADNTSLEGKAMNRRTEVKIK